MSRFAEFRSVLTEEELQNWHLLLSAMVGKTAERHLPPSSEPEASSWWTMVAMICDLYPGGVRRLPVLDPVRESFADLAAEATDLMDTQVRFGDKISGTVESGMLATAVAQDPRIHAEMERQAGVRLGPVASVSYFYYHRPGDYLLPHADPIVSSGLICLTTLVHTPRSDGGPPSALLAHGPSRVSERFELAPGQSVMFFGGGTVHSREPIGPDEVVINLSIGFPYAEDRPAPLW